METLRRLPEGSIHCAVTSPPYWGLRDYDGEPQVWGGDPACDHEWGELGVPHHPNQVEQTKWKTAEAAGKGQTAGSGRFCLRCDAWLGQFGLEPTPQMYVEHSVEIFRELWRVLRDDGTFWLNLGDSYANDGKWGGSTGGKHAGGLHGETGVGRGRRSTGLKPKDLVGIPWRVAFALQDDGWYLRSDIIWAKGNPLPESVRDRVTRSHEYIFLFTKRPRYFYDHEAIKEPMAGPDRVVPQGFGGTKGSGQDASGPSAGRTYSGNAYDASQLSGRNKRSVWNVNPRPYKGAHFAVFPPELVEPCVLAGTSERGCCPMCGTAWERETERGSDVPMTARRQHLADASVDPAQRLKKGGGTARTTLGAGRGGDVPMPGTRTVGWHQGCGCPEHEPVPCVVVDPFSGSGTTGVVSLDHGRSYVGLDVNADYRDLAVARLLGEDAPSRADEDEGGGILELFGVEPG